jgi:hypothetical protein
MQTVQDPQHAVTAARFDSAKTYEEYVASVERNREKFAYNLEQSGCRRSWQSATARWWRDRTDRRRCS